MRLIVSGESTLAMYSSVNTVFGELQIEVGGYVPKGYSYIIEEPTGGKPRAFQWVTKPMRRGEETKLPNDKGWYTKDEVIATNLPYWIAASSRWTSEPYNFAILLSKTRCQELGAPILSNGREHPSAFRYAAAAGKGDNRHRYIPLYDRTEMYSTIIAENIRLYNYEQMGAAK
ncbi:hypothetical protein HUB94_02775 (plasmid) [Paenibacillus cellulosilyticus]|nr:hypothetical protein HUB94_02775 [Paenibacillus cellulosilyticus]